jgi:hypothetical protein
MACVRVLRLAVSRQTMRPCVRMAVLPRHFSESTANTAPVSDAAKPKDAAEEKEVKFGRKPPERWGPVNPTPRDYRMVRERAIQAPSAHSVACTALFADATPRVAASSG